MVEPFIGEIRMFGGNFAPRGWAFCNGQLLPISPNTALFSILGTIYGGNGTSTFALPNLQGCVPMQPGQGPGLSPYSIGDSSGTQTVTLIQAEMPSHTHLLQAAGRSDQVSPANNSLAFARYTIYNDPGNPPTTMSEKALAITGENLPHNNLQPYLTINFIIALQGIFPPRG